MSGTSQRGRLDGSAPEEGRAGPATDRGADSGRAEEARRKLKAMRRRHFRSIPELIQALQDFRALYN